MTLYAIQPDPTTGSLDDARVLAQSPYGWEFLEQTITLWHLIDETRASEIAAIMARASRAPGDRASLIPKTRRTGAPSRWRRGCHRCGWVGGPHWRAPAERLEELAKQVPSMDLKTERSLKSKTSALGEIINNAIFVRNFLSNALDAGCVVVLA
jgi:hypothetical protein